MRRLPERTRIARAIGRSRWEPVFWSSAGARLTVTFFGGEIKVRASNGGANAFTGFSNGFAGHTDDIKTG